MYLHIYIYIFTTNHNLHISLLGAPEPSQPSQPPGSALLHLVWSNVGARGLANPDERPASRLCVRTDFGVLRSLTWEKLLQNDS